MAAVIHFFTNGATEPTAHLTSISLAAEERSVAARSVPPEQRAALSAQVCAGLLAVAVLVRLPTALDGV